MDKFPNAQMKMEQAEKNIHIAEEVKVTIENTMKENAKKFNPINSAQSISR